jgi:hypothetical protein
VLSEPLPSNYRSDTCKDTQTDGRDLWSTPLRWAQVPWYAYQISYRLFQVFKSWGGDTQTHRQQGDFISPFLLFSRQGKWAENGPYVRPAGLLGQTVCLQFVNAAEVSVRSRHECCAAWIYGAISVQRKLDTNTRTIVKNRTRLSSETIRCCIILCTTHPGALSIQGNMVRPACLHRCTAPYLSQYLLMQSRKVPRRGLICLKVTHFPPAAAVRQRNSCNWLCRSWASHSGPDDQKLLRLCTFRK